MGLKVRRRVFDSFKHRRNAGTHMHRSSLCSNISVSVPECRGGCLQEKKRGVPKYYLSKSSIKHGSACDNVAWRSGADTGTEIVETHAESSEGKGTEAKWPWVGRRSGGLEDGVEGWVHIDVHLERRDTHIFGFEVSMKGQLLLLRLLWLLLWVKMDGMIDKLVGLLLDIKDIF